VSGAERVATLDIGTNSVLLLIAQSSTGTLTPVLERATITRLGENVDAQRKLAKPAVERTLACLEDYAREIAAHGVTRVAAVGTSAMRDAAGGTEFLDAAERLLGVWPRVISGAEEADLTFHGALSGIDARGDVCVFDVGGGSTEVITGSADAPRRVDSAVSLDIGSVRLFERHVRHDPPLAAEMARVVADIEAALALASKPAPNSTLVGVAGTVTTLAAIDLGLAQYDSARVHGAALSRARVAAIAERLQRLTLPERQQLAGLEPKRADVIVVGAALVRCVLEWCGSDELVVSDRGVRWGLAERLALPSA
jgi:exopolyphosphatase / guanosine-5'-triphosphate,3'-diphosphate pyrophosphatase